MLRALSNQPRAYAWGSSTLLADLQGRPAATRPEAEVWFGDHPADPADLAGGGTLDEVTGGRLPYLLKLLAAAAPLSIQAHPTREQAEAGFAREAHLASDDPARSYRDANHKPELIVALSERFEAMVGLRPLEETAALLETLPGTPGVLALRGRLTASGSLAEVIGWALTDAGAAEIAEIADAIASASAPAFAVNLAALARIAALHPGDGGLIVALLMNHLELRAGEAIFLPAGVPHAYLSGLGVEIMAASDNVLRGGLTSKHIDVPGLLEILDDSPARVPVQHPDAASAIAHYQAPVTDFALQRVRLDRSPVGVSLSGPAIVLATAGQVTVSTGGEGLEVPVGTAAFVAEEASLSLSGSGEAFIAQPG